MTLAKFVKCEPLLMPCCDSDVVGWFDVDLIYGYDGDRSVMFPFECDVSPLSHGVAASVGLFESSH